jgi:hypothetical protein
MSEYENYESEGDKVDLTSFDDEFNNAEAPTQEEVPDGKYQVRIDSVRLEHSQKGDPMIKWDLVVLSGSQAGRRVFKNSVITAASLPYVKGDLKTVGLVLTKFSDLEGRLEELLDVTLELTKRTKGDYSNVYFNRRIQIPVVTSNRVDGEPF